MDLLLKEKAQTFPASPGVYHFYDANGEIIYIGKAKVLKNRVTQYFQNPAGLSFKIRRMVASARDIAYIVTASEFEALMLECSLIRRYKPKYNTLLKNSPGYPYVRVDMQEPYPKFTIDTQRKKDGALYFGPFGGGYTTMTALAAVSEMLQLPVCNRQFPRDIGKERPCLHYQLGRCFGPCRPEADPNDYRRRIEQAVMLFSGKYEGLEAQLKEEMEAAAERLEFEQAAQIRNRLLAVSRFGKEQQTMFLSHERMDAIGFHVGETRMVISVLFVREGQITAQHMETFKIREASEAADLYEDFLKQFYPGRDFLPDIILLPKDFEDRELLERLLSEERGKAVTLAIPKRGPKLKLILQAEANARQEVDRITTPAEKLHFALSELARLAMLPAMPKRIEAFDISNTGDDAIVGSMIVLENGKPAKSAYRRFTIRGQDKQDDYAAMSEMLSRRLDRIHEQGAFGETPDLILIDGGRTHAMTVKRLLSVRGLSIPLLGMVKDGRHQTRALVTPEGEEIGLSGHPAVYALIAKAQEEAHRFALAFHRAKKRKRTLSTSLTKIPGIGKVRATLLLRKFGSIAKIKAADIDQLAEHLPRTVAENVYAYFHPPAPDVAPPEETGEENASDGKDETIQ